MSYSGDTEETRVDGVERGRARRAARRDLVRRRARRRSRATRARCTSRAPTGFLPRAAIGALVAPLLVTLFRIGLAPGRARECSSTRRRSSRAAATACVPSVDGAANPARELARQIGRTIPSIYGGGALGGGRRVPLEVRRQRERQGARVLEPYPELDHNEICGWGQHGDVTRQLITLVELRHGFEHERLAAALRRRPARSSTSACTRCSTVEAEGEGRLAQLLDLMYVGDWASCYLALQNDVDPGPIDAIFELKSRLAQTT